MTVIHYIIIGFAFIISLADLIIICYDKIKYRAISFILSLCAIIFSFIAVFQSYPVWETSCVDGNSFIVGVMGALIAILIGWQLYNALHLKEDADTVKTASEQASKLEERISKLEFNNNELSSESQKLQKNVDNLKESTTEIEKRLKGLFKLVDNPEYIYVMTDANNKMLFCIRNDGSVDWAVGVPKPIKDELSKLADRLKAIESNRIKK